MSDATLYSLLALLLAVLGFAWLALALPNHWRKVHGGLPLTTPRKIAMRGCASVMLVLSLAFSLAGDAPAMAILLWVMLLAVATLIVALTLSWRAPLLAWLWPVNRTKEKHLQAE